MGITSRGTTAEAQCTGPRVYTDPTYGPFRIWMAKTMLHPKTLPCTCPPILSRADSTTRTDRFKPMIVA